MKHMVNTYDTNFALIPDFQMADSICLTSLHLHVKEMSFKIIVLLSFITSSSSRYYRPVPPFTNMIWL